MLDTTTIRTYPDLLLAANDLHGDAAATFAAITTDPTMLERPHNRQQLHQLDADITALLDHLPHIDALAPKRPTPNDLDALHPQQLTGMVLANLHALRHLTRLHLDGRAYHHGRLTSHADLASAVLLQGQALTALLTRHASLQFLFEAPITNPDPLGLHP